MKALLVSEGKHERSGALGALVARLAQHEMAYDQERISRTDIHAHHGSGRGYFKKAIRWMLEAEDQGYDALILVIDEDGRSERVTDICDAQRSTLGITRRALGVAIRTFDAWMLADEKALTEVLETRVGRQPNPETLTHPKEACAELLEDSGKSLSQADMYAHVARGADLDIMQERSPKGFAPFAGRVRAL